MNLPIRAPIVWRTGNRWFWWYCVNGRQASIPFTMLESLHMFMQCRGTNNPQPPKKPKLPAAKSAVSIAPFKPVVSANAVAAKVQQNRQPKQTGDGNNSMADYARKKAGAI